MFKKIVVAASLIAAVVGCASKSKVENGGPVTGQYGGTWFGTLGTTGSVTIDTDGLGRATDGTITAPGAAPLVFKGAQQRGQFSGQFADGSQVTVGLSGSVLVIQTATAKHEYSR